MRVYQCFTLKRLNFQIFFNKKIMQNFIKHLLDLDINVSSLVFSLEESLINITDFMNFQSVTKKEKQKLEEHTLLLMTFISFLGKEEDLFIDSKIFQKKDSDISAFDEINFTPAYIQKKTDIKVVDLTHALETVKETIVTNIEMITEIGFPKDPYENGDILIINIAKTITKKLVEDERNSVSYLVEAYENVDDLKKMLLTEIEELMEPVR